MLALGIRADLALPVGGVLVPARLVSPSPRTALPAG
jgi:hypothetical protein